MSHRMWMYLLLQPMNIRSDDEPSLSEWPALPRHRAALLVADVVESVRLMQVDEDGVVRQWRQFVHQVRSQILPAHKGVLIKSLGDGLLLEFQRTGDAVQAALGMQALLGGEQPAGPFRLRLRVGVHVADVMRDELDLYGSGVNLAARLATLAQPGEIVVSAEVRDTLLDGLDAEVEDLGDCYLKHLIAPVRAFRVSTAASVSVRPAWTAAGSSDLRPTLAVLPFDSSATDPRAIEIARALVDELIGGLSSAQDLNVVSRLSTMALEGRGLAPEEAASQLGAHYLVSGRLLVLQDRLTAWLELVDAQTGSAMWHKALRCSLDDLLDPQQLPALELARGIVDAVVQHQASRATAQPLTSLRSYSLMLGAMTLMHRSTRHEFETARGMLEHLVDREQAHARPRAWLANWHALRVTQLRPVDSAADVEQALYHARQALARDPCCPLALAVDGVLRMNLTKDFSLAGQRFEAALDSNPNEALAWLFKGVLHAFQGGHGLAEPAAERALALTPLDPMRHYFDSLAATAALGDGLYALAEQRALRALRANRQHPSTFRALAIAQALQGKLAEARQTVRELLTLSPGYGLRDFREMSGFSQGPLAGLFSDALAAAGLMDH